MIAKKIKIFLLALLLSTGSDGCRDNKSARADTKQSKNAAQVIDVEKLVAHPAHFKGNLAVSGTVKKVEKKKSMFALGCEDACVLMPVMYKGQMPRPGSAVVIYGKIKKVNGKYIFDARKIKQNP